MIKIILLTSYLAFVGGDLGAGVSQEIPCVNNADCPQVPCYVSFCEENVCYMTASCV